MKRFLMFLSLLGSAEVSALEPLTQQPGDPQNGREVVIDRDRGHCLLCHQIAQINEGFQGNIGPPLSDVGSRLDAALLRERLVDPTRLNPDTVMPAYYRVDNLRQVAREYADQPILDAQEIEDVVAYLQTLTQALDVES
jgi:sulfur-oxidizing protein SoxX